MMNSDKNIESQITQLHSRLVQNILGTISTKFALGEHIVLVIRGHGLDKLLNEFKHQDLPEMVPCFLATDDDNLLYGSRIGASSDDPMDLRTELSNVGITDLSSVLWIDYRHANNRMNIRH